MRTKRLAALLAPLALLAAVSPLLAPSCSSNASGTKAFAKNSIIIAMDGCYQGDGVTAATACGGGPDVGNVLHAYGLVYQLLQNNITVYWVIEPTKSSMTSVDMTVQWTGGPPVSKYNWANGSF